MTRTFILALALASTLLWTVSTIAGDTCGCREAENKNTVIVLIGHGVPASDFPSDRMGKFFKLSITQHSHGKKDDDHSHSHDDKASEYELLEQEVRSWPRTPENDPYKFGVDKIAKSLARQTGCKVIVGFNEFCAPTTENAIAQAANIEGIKRVLVTTVMMTPGGGHSERDIANSIADESKKHPNLKITYAWPIDTRLIASLLTKHLSTFDLTPPAASCPGPKAAKGSKS